MVLAPFWFIEENLLHSKLSTEKALYMGYIFFTAPYFCHTVPVDAQLVPVKRVYFSVGCTYHEKEIEFVSICVCFFFFKKESPTLEAALTAIVKTSSLVTHEICPERFSVIFQISVDLSGTLFEYMYSNLQIRCRIDSIIKWLKPVNTCSILQSM